MQVDPAKCCLALHRPHLRDPKHGVIDITTHSPPPSSASATIPSTIASTHTKPSSAPTTLYMISTFSSSITLVPTIRLFTSSIKMALYQAKGQAEQFTKSTLNRSDIHPTSPIPQFHSWFSHAQSSSSSSSAVVPHPEACALSTAELPSGRISSRMVYLKELDAAGRFVVYTNLGTSRKAADLKTNPRASLLFFWEALQRQVRVEGMTERMSSEESQAYFDTRVRGSRIGAWASRQSQVLQPGGGGDDGRAQLEEWVKDVEERFEGTDDIPVPEFWGGLRIIPERIEFWQGRESRLHDRFVYEREEGVGEGGWRLERLSP